MNGKLRTAKATTPMAALRELAPRFARLRETFDPGGSLPDDCAAWAESHDRAIDALERAVGMEIGELRIALLESLKLQRHYAELLNMHDGGQRHSFPTIEQWIARLRETGTL